MIFLRRDLVREAGGFQSQFDGSQDYDLLLRVTERTNRIHHIPRVLYHWRRSENSSASDVRQKPGQLEASRRAIEAHLKRRGEQAHVAVDWRTHAFCVRRELREPKKISVIIPSFRGAESLERCLENLISRTSYPNYEIVIVQVGERDKIAEAATDSRIMCCISQTLRMIPQQKIMPSHRPTAHGFFSSTTRWKPSVRTGSQSWLSMCNGPRLAQSARDWLIRAAPSNTPDLFSGPMESRSRLFAVSHRSILA